MQDCILMTFGKIQIQEVTHGYQNLVSDVFQNVIFPRHGMC
jgi:hypothetical protein